MKQIVKIIRKVDIEREYKKVLIAEQDYELASLHEAMQANDQSEIDRSKKRLSEIHTELAELS